MLSGRRLKYEDDEEQLKKVENNKGLLSRQRVEMLNIKKRKRKDDERQLTNER